MDASFLAGEGHLCQEVVDDSFVKVALDVENEDLGDNTSEEDLVDHS